MIQSIRPDFNQADHMNFGVIKFPLYYINVEDLLVK